MSRHATGSNGRETGVADDELAQLSLFAPLSAVATETMSVSPWHEPLLDEWSAVDNAIEVKLVPPPMLAAPAASPDGRTRRQTKDALRAANAAAARDVARHTDLSHAQVNAEIQSSGWVRADRRGDCRAASNTT
jgi:hypothetical protein